MLIRNLKTNIAKLIFSYPANPNREIDPETTFGYLYGRGYLWKCKFIDTKNSERYPKYFIEGNLWIHDNHPHFTFESYGYDESDHTLYITEIPLKDGPVQLDLFRIRGSVWSSYIEILTDEGKFGYLFTILPKPIDVTLKYE